MDIVGYNSDAWDLQAEKKNKWTIPVDEKTIVEARKGNWKVVLTPTKPVPDDWFGDISGKKILCLASAGGQQGPIFAAAGAEVTVFDNSSLQLSRDRSVAEREGLDIRLEQGDMRDLGRFADETFDLIFHPVSNCFVDDVIPVWKECFSVLKNNGILLSAYCNPFLFVFDFEKWDEEKKLEVKYRIPYSDLEQLPREQLEKRIADKDPIEFGHSLEALIGGQIEAGFVITGFYEDNAGGDLLDPYIDSFIATRAEKRSNI